MTNSDLPAFVEEDSAKNIPLHNINMFFGLGVNEVNDTYL